MTEEAGFRLGAWSGASPNDAQVIASLARGILDFSGEDTTLSSILEHENGDPIEHRDVASLIDDRGDWRGSLFIMFANHRLQIFSHLRIYRLSEAQLSRKAFEFALHEFQLESEKGHGIKKASTFLQDFCTAFRATYGYGHEQSSPIPTRGTVGIHAGIPPLVWMNLLGKELVEPGLLGASSGNIEIEPTLTSTWIRFGDSPRLAQDANLLRAAADIANRIGVERFASPSGDGEGYRLRTGGPLAALAHIFRLAGERPIRSQVMPKISQAGLICKDR